VAVKSEIVADLTLEIDGKSVSPDKFLRSVRAFFTILNEVTTKVAGKRGGVQWKVKVKEGSNLVGVVPEAGHDPVVVARIISTMSGGLSELEDRASLPHHFSERAMKGLRDLGAVVGTTVADDTTVRVWARKEPLPITHKSVAHVAQLIASEHEDYGSIEGKLQTVTERGGLQFVVYEPLWDQAVRCYIPERLIDTAMANFRNRVEVYGLIKYRKDGKPLSIHVDDIIAFPPKERIPSFREVRGILR
jgi:hypothetical protein